MTATDTSAITVDVTRSGRWWAIAVPSMPNVHSQCRRLEQVDEYAREAIALERGASPEEVGELVIAVAPPADLAPLIDRAEQTANAARAAGAAAARARAEAVGALAAAGYPTRDIGALLGISHQRVSQILAESPGS